MQSDRDLCQALFPFYRPAFKEGKQDTHAGHLSCWFLGFFSSNVSFYFSSALVFVCCCYALIIGVALMILLTQQIVLISFNITSYEWRHMLHEASFWSSLMTSPHDKGIFANWAEFIKT